ncbi:cleft palate-related protein 1 [Mus musculus]|uniref:Cleft palate-related protein 1 n=1 Tax=Mus musculus TaxID=10090 RepID=Q8R5F9_MOUSE|nr:cleft palate-related protein 1 [Mus musculus]AAI19354.1 CDNA sequence AY074887 [Mus musculus]AAI20607.1 CDNA sequence AY074887 [Mus musculus]AAL71887.2 cleft palate-related protein 1 [Mus musculus]|eukprot:NP_660264.1 cleft palate-related protein 1 [Mus musculus]
MAKHPRRIWLPRVRRTARGRGGAGGRGSSPSAGAGSVCPRGLCRSTTSALAAVCIRGGLEGGGKRLYRGEWNQIPPTLCTPLSFSLLYHSNGGQSSNCIDKSNRLLFQSCPLTVFPLFFLLASFSPFSDPTL